MVFFTSGVGVHKHKLESFEMALRNARIEKFNLVRVSSIYPPNCKVVPIEEGLSYLSPGEVTYCVISNNETNEPHRLISAAVGVAIPSEESHYGYISEHHDFGLTEKEAADLSEDMAASMLASTLGIDFDPESSWDEREQIFRMSNRIVKTFSAAKAAYGYSDKSERRKWTTVLSAAIFIL
jgi:arginine decarboxylase